MRYIIAVAILIAGCKSPEKIAARKEAKIEQERRQRIELLEQVRKDYPCDTIKKYYIDTIVRTLPGDTTYHNDTVFIRLPGRETTRTEVRTVIDRAAEQSLKDQLASVQYAADLLSKENIEQDKEIHNLVIEKEEWKSRAQTRFYWLIGCGIAFAAAIFLRIKGIL